MSVIKELLNTLPQSGKVEWISIRPEKRGEVKSVSEVVIDKNEGLIGDHYSKAGGKRMITLIQKEHLDTIKSILGKAHLDPSLTRRNIMVSGINLLSLHKRHFSIGKDIVLECTGYCHPCSRMETNLGPGGYNAMRGHGGLTAKVIKGGKLKIGDQIKLILESEE